MNKSNISVQKILRWIVNRSSFLSYYRSYWECQSEFKREQKANGNIAPVIVYQPGRVGSKTVQKILDENYHRSTVFHIHYFIGANYQPIFDRNIKRGYPRQNAAIKMARCDCYRKQMIDQEFRDALKVVTLTRDPGAMILSAFTMDDCFFHNSEISKMITEQRDKSELYSKIQQLFTREKEYWFEKTAFWFDKELNHVLSINIFDKKFPIDAGYDIYRSDRMKVLLIRLEDLNRCYRQAFDEFLGIQVENINKDNSAEKLGYGELYTHVRQAVKFPEEYIQRVYVIPWVKHMYSNEEIENFKKKWM